MTNEKYEVIEIQTGAALSHKEAFNWIEKQGLDYLKYRVEPAKQ